MKTTIATTVAALLIAAVSFGATVAPAAAAMSKHPAHWGQHQVCKTTWDHHHHKHTVCTWVKNRH